MMNTNLEESQIDKTIKKCEKLIFKHSKKANRVFLLILSTSILFLSIVSYPIIESYFQLNQGNYSIEIARANSYMDKLGKIENVTKEEFDNLISKAVSFQKLTNAKNDNYLSYLKMMNDSSSLNLKNYILYAVFLLIFGVSTSFYKFHLKEISKLEHYLIGFHRIRIANEIKESNDFLVINSLTDNPFSIDNKTSKYETFIPGHLTLDFLKDTINKIFDKIDIIKKDDKKV